MRKYVIREGAMSLACRTEGSGPDMVLLHGFCGSSHYWDKVIPVLAGQYRLIVPDLRGHGESDAPAGPYTMEMMAEDIRLLLDELGVDKTLMYGHSLGGYITLAFAEAYPERLNGWGLVHSTAYPDDKQAKENRLKGMQAIRENGIQSYVDGLVPRLFAPAHLESMSGAVEEMKRIGHGTSPVGAIATLEAMRGRPDRRHVLRESRVPVALIAGAEDQVVPVPKVHAAEGPHIAAYVVEDCGHMGMIEAPDRLCRCLLEHAGRCRE